MAWHQSWQIWGKCHLRLQPCSETASYLALFPSLVAQGKDEMHNLVKICRKAIGFLDKRADSVVAEAF